MSKITPKNLSYDTTLPPFLARLQAQNANNDGRQDFHAVRPKKPRDAELDKEDEPVFFDEATGETMTKSEWEEKEKFGDGEGNKLEKGADGEEVERGEGVKEDNQHRIKEKEKEKENIAGIGGARKRKAGKVVGGEEEEQEQDANDASGKSTKRTYAKETYSTPQTAVKEKKAEKGGKTAKKGKKIKLSFGDDE